MKNVYETIKDMPNPSQGLLKYFKRNPYKRIWAYRDHNKISDFTSLKKLKGLDLNGNLTLKVGSPSTMYRGDNSGGNVAKSRSFDGSHLVGHMFGQGFKNIFFQDYLQKIRQNIKREWRYEVKVKLSP